MTFPGPKPQSAVAARAASLDGLRGLAAAAVFVFHAWLYTKPVPRAGARSTAADYALHELRLGLVLFFVLSGFLLFRPWVAAALGDGRRPQLGRYVLHRAARIAPAYYVALAGSVLLLWGLGGSPGVRLPPLDALPLFLVFAQNASLDTVMRLDPPMWTLAIEVAFYAALPLIGWLALRTRGERRRQALIPLALIAAGLAWNLTLSPLGMPYGKSLPAMLPYFGAGMLAAVLLEGRRLGRAAAAALLGAGVALVAADAAAQSLLAAAGAGGIPFTGDLTAAAGFAALVACAAGRPPRLLAARPLVALGTLSYGFYLWHVPLLLWLRAHGLLPLDALGASAVGGVAALAFAAASWHLVERPVLRRARARSRVREPVSRAAHPEPRMSSPSHMPGLA